MLYLAYGSNLHPQRLGERVPSATLLGTALINDRVLRFHKRSVVDGSAKCNLVMAAGTVHVAVYEISADEKPNLDRAEGLGIGYRIETLNVSGYGDCYTYIAMDTHIDESLKPYSWYRDWVILGCESMKFPQTYLDTIAAVQAVEDPYRERNARQMRAVYQARNAVS